MFIIIPKMIGTRIKYIRHDILTGFLRKDYSSMILSVNYFFFELIELRSVYCLKHIILSILGD